MEWGEKTRPHFRVHNDHPPLNPWKIVSATEFGSETNIQAVWLHMHAIYDHMPACTSLAGKERCRTCLKSLGTLQQKTWLVYICSTMPPLLLSSVRASFLLRWSPPAAFFFLLPFFPFSPSPPHFPLFGVVERDMNHQVLGGNVQGGPGMTKCPGSTLQSSLLNGGSRHSFPLVFSKKGVIICLFFKKGVILAFFSKKG